VRATQPISRADIAQRLGVHRSTVTDIVKPLLASGVLVEAGAEVGGGHAGRPRVGLSLRCEGQFFIGARIGACRSHVAAATAGGLIISAVTFATPAGSEEALAEIRSAVAAVSRAARPRSLVGIGVSVPGPVNPARTCLLRAPHLGWFNVAVAAEVRRAAFGRVGENVAVAVENDATASAIYELRRMQAFVNGSVAPEDFVLVRAGGGIGVSLVLGGEVYRGAGGGKGPAGEFGHTTIMAGGEQCFCGNRGCWEMYASADSAAARYLGRRLPARGGQRYFGEVLTRAAANDSRARRALEQTGEYLGIGIANIIKGVGIPRVVVCGRIVLGWRFIEESLKTAVGRALGECLPGWSVEADGDAGAGFGGALEVAVDDYLTRIV
jgi:predicted NBD/HSP70 family sugar kinase